MLFIVDQIITLLEVVEDLPMLDQIIMLVMVATVVAEEVVNQVVDLEMQEMLVLQV